MEHKQRPSSLFFTSSLAFVFATILTGGEGLHINKLVVPDVVQNGTDSSVVLDCDYYIESGEVDGLVVKWFFNNNPSPVYQWIYKMEPQALGVLKGKVNLSYKASDEKTAMYRAVEIKKPTTELGGEYRCVVSTFFSEIAESKKMVIFVPEKNLMLTHTRNSTHFTLMCAGERVYPEPKIAISKNDRIQESQVETESKEGLYNIFARLTLDAVDIKDPTNFDCILRIPEANYTVKRSIVYFPQENSGQWLTPASLLWTLLISLATLRL